MLNAHEWSVHVGSALFPLLVSLTVSFRHMCAVLYLWLHSVVSLESLSLWNTDILQVYFLSPFMCNVFFVQKTIDFYKRSYISEQLILEKVGENSFFFSFLNCQFIVNSCLAHCPPSSSHARGWCFIAPEMYVCNTGTAPLHSSVSPLAGNTSFAPFSSPLVRVFRSAQAPKSSLTGAEVLSQSPHLVFSCKLLFILKIKQSLSFTIALRSPLLCFPYPHSLICHLSPDPNPLPVPCTANQQQQQILQLNVELQLQRFKFDLHPKTIFFPAHC